MSLELIYTSVPHGLAPGSVGFCTAAATGGLSRQVIAKLEALSGYQFHFGLSDPRAAENPANYAHTQVRIGAETMSVLSRIAFSGADYSGRTNKIAHHFLLESGERLPNGPAWMLLKMAPATFASAYEGGPRDLPRRDLRTALASVDRPVGPAAAWQHATGDAGWAGVLVRAFREHSKVPAFVVFEPGQDLLPLFEESLALLPPEERWQVGFATYYTSLPAGCQYHWRGILAGSATAKEVRQFPDATVIDLTRPSGRAPDDAYTEAARAGRMLPPARTTERPQIRLTDRVPETAVMTGGSALNAEEPILATDPGQDGPRATPQNPPPAQDPWQTLTRRAHRARWVGPLTVGIILLIISNAVLVGLYLRDYWLPRQGPTSTPPVATARENPTPATPESGVAETPASEGTTAPPTPAVPETAAPPESPPTATPTAPSTATAPETPPPPSSPEQATPPAEGQSGDGQSGNPPASQPTAPTVAPADGANAPPAAPETPTTPAVPETTVPPSATPAEAPPATPAAPPDTPSASPGNDSESQGERLPDKVGNPPSAENLQIGFASREDFQKTSPPFDLNSTPWKTVKGIVMPTLLGNGREFKLLDKPRILDEKHPDEFGLSLTGPSLEVKVPSENAMIGDKSIATFQISLDKNTPILTYKTNGDLGTKHKNILKWLVVEVAGLDDNRIYQCFNERDPAKTVAFGYNANGKAKSNNTQSPISYYPWPDTLTLRVGSNKEVALPKTLSQNFELHTENCEKTILLQVEWGAPRANSCELNCSIPTLSGAIKSVALNCATEWNDANSKLQVAQKRLDDLQKEKGPQETKKKQLEEEIANWQMKLAEAEKPLQDLLDAAKKAFEANGKVSVRDVWGVPVVEINLTFSGEAREIIYNITKD